MKTTTTLLVSIPPLLVAYYGYAQAVATKKVKQAEAIKIASHLTLGMREVEAEKLLSHSGLTNNVKAGCIHGWTSFFPLGDGWSLDLDISPKEARVDFAGGVVRAAEIRSNGVKIATITLTNAP